MKYITLYNVISLVLWLLILINAINDGIKYTSITYARTYSGNVPHQFMIYVQMFNSSLELVHTILGIVRTPLLAIVLQSSARLLIMIGVCYAVPQSPANYQLLSFTTLSIAWSLSEIIRCGFYSFKPSPYWLVWLRYTGFFVLYPLGLLSELFIVYSTLDSVKSNYYYFLVFALTTYVPGFTYLYGHMIKQRKVVLAKSIKGAKRTD